MNKNASRNNLFVDRPLTTAVVPASRISTLSLLSAGESDFAETTLRFVLVVCLLCSLALCVVRMNSGTGEAGSNASLRLPAWSQTAPSVPSLPTVQIDSVIR